MAQPPPRSRLNAIIAPSLLAGDFAHLADESKRMMDAGADWLHVDVMDGHFVPNLTLGAPVVKSLRRALVAMATPAYLDVHLMVTSPAQWLDDFADAGASGFTFHIEAVARAEVGALVERIVARGMRAGVAVKPGTPVEALIDLLHAHPLVSLALVMTVEPGFGGQAFQPAQLEKVRALRRTFPLLDVQVDGGLGPGNIEAAATAGANVIVAGTSVFAAPDGPAAAICTLRSAVDAAIAT